MNQSRNIVYFHTLNYIFAHYILTNTILYVWEWYINICLFRLSDSAVQSAINYSRARKIPESWSGPRPTVLPTARKWQSIQCLNSSNAETCLSDTTETWWLRLFKQWRRLMISKPADRRDSSTVEWLKPRQRRSKASCLSLLHTVTLLVTIKSRNTLKRRRKKRDRNN